jgi:hypothetical protein
MSFAHDGVINDALRKRLGRNSRDGGNTAHDPAPLGRTPSNKVRLS